MSLEAEDKAAAVHAVAPRVTLADIEAAIADEHYVTGAEAVETVPGYHALALDLLTLCIIVLKNGFTVVGKSAPASPENFNREFGRKLARDDAMRQLWGFMGFALRDRLHHEKDKQLG